MSRDPNQSIERLQSFDWDELEDVESGAACWFTEVKEKLKCRFESEMTSERFMVLTKSVLSNWLATAAGTMMKQANMMMELKEHVELLKTEALADKNTVIELQNKLLESKDKQLQSLQSKVETTVQNTVQSEIKCYSDAVKKNSGMSCSPETLKMVMKSVVAEEDRSRNLILYGLREEEGEQLAAVVSEVLTQVGENPRFEATRVGRKRPDMTIRPVKVTLPTSTAAHQILMKSGRLSLIEERRKVYICPDRSSEERSARRLLVTDLKKLKSEQPLRTHYIRGGKLCSSDKKDP